MKKRNYFKSVLHLLASLYLKLKLRKLNSYVSEGTGSIVMQNPYLKVTIITNKNSKFILNGTLEIVSHLGGEAPVYINLSEGACLTINGDFLIGNGVRIHLHKNSNLTIGGKQFESASGITENTKIMVFKSITIGKDFLCAWDVFISDSDWHSIIKKNQIEDHNKSIVIDDHVWIAPGCSILKGTRIGKGSIIGSKTILTNKTFPAYSLIAGNPAIVIGNEINWSRDI